MKKYFFIGLGLILLLSIGIIIYGIYLNTHNESTIINRMSNRSVALKGQSVRVRDIKPVLELNTIKLYSDNMADAVALIDGNIIHSYVKRNATVSKGEVMFRLSNEEIPLKISQIDSDILKAQVELKRAKNTYERYKMLMTLNATSAEKLDEVEAAYNAAIADLENIQMQKAQLLVQQSRQNVIAPIDGEVLLLYKQNGSFVTAGTPIALVGDFSKLLFTQTLTDTDINRFIEGEELSVIFQGNDLQKSYDTDYAAGNLGDEQIFSAHIVEAMPSLSEPASIRKVVFEIDNSSGILEPQNYRNVALQSNRSISCLSIPLSSMLTQDKNSVFVLTSDNTIERREIISGINDGQYIEIISGLSEGDIVIISDTDGLSDGTTVNVSIENEE